MEPVEPVQMNIYQSSTYRKDSGWLHFEYCCHVWHQPRRDNRIHGMIQKKYGCICFLKNKNTCQRHGKWQLEVLGVLQASQLGWKPELFTSLLITQDLSKIKKIPDTLLQTLVSRKHVQSFSKKIELQGSWGSSKFSDCQTEYLVS